MRMLLIQYDKKFNNPQIIGGYAKLEEIDDVFYYIGSLINSFEEELSFSFLAYYNFDFDKWDMWLDFVKNNDNVICRFRSNKYCYEIQLDEDK